MKKLTLTLAAVTLMALASCKDEAAKGNDPMDNNSLEFDDSNSNTHAEPGSPEAQDSTGLYSPDSTMHSPPTVTKPQ